MNDAMIKALVERESGRISEAAHLVFYYVAKRERAGIYGVFPSTAWDVIPIVQRPLAITKFHCWLACGLLLTVGRMRPMNAEDVAGRHLSLRCYWPDPAPLMLVDRDAPLVIG